MNPVAALLELLANREYNRELYRTGRANRNEKRETTIGWRPDLIECDDGFTEACGKTPSGEREYYKKVNRA